MPTRRPTLITVSHTIERLRGQLADLEVLVADLVKQIETVQANEDAEQDRIKSVNHDGEAVMRYLEQAAEKLDEIRRAMDL